MFVFADDDSSTPGVDKFKDEVSVVKYIKAQLQKEYKRGQMDGVYRLFCSNLFKINDSFDNSLPVSHNANGRNQHLSFNQLPVTSMDDIDNPNILEISDITESQAVMHSKPIAKKILENWTLTAPDKKRKSREIKRPINLTDSYEYDDYSLKTNEKVVGTPPDQKISELTTFTAGLSRSSKRSKPPIDDIDNMDDIHEVDYIDKLVTSSSSLQKTLPSHLRDTSSDSIKSSSKLNEASSRRSSGERSISSSKSSVNDTGKKTGTLGEPPSLTPLIKKYKSKLLIGLVFIITGVDVNTRYSLALRVEDL